MDYGKGGLDHTFSKAMLSTRRTERSHDEPQGLRGGFGGETASISPPRRLPAGSRFASARIVASCMNRFSDQVIPVKADPTAPPMPAIPGFVRAIGSSNGQPLTVSMALKRRDPTEAHVETVFSREVGFTGGNEKAEILIDRAPLRQEGDYFLQLSTSGPATGSAPLSLTTPTLVTIGTSCRRRSSHPTDS
jgi:hypothetical protein